MFTDKTLGLKIYDAMDFGPRSDPFESPHRVLLRCYGDEHTCYDDVSEVFILCYSFTNLFFHDSILYYD